MDTVHPIADTILSKNCRYNTTDSAGLGTCIHNFDQLGLFATCDLRFYQQNSGAIAFPGTFAPHLRTSHSRVAKRWPIWSLRTHIALNNRSDPMAQNCPWYCRFDWFGAVNCLQIRSTWFVCAFLTAILPAKTVASCTPWSFGVSKHDFAFSCRWDLAHLKLARAHTHTHCTQYATEWPRAAPVLQIRLICSH